MLKKIILISLLAVTLIGCTTPRKPHQRVILDVGGQLDIIDFDYDPDRGFFEAIREGSIIAGANPSPVRFNAILKKMVRQSQISIQPGGCTLQGVLYDFYPKSNFFPQNTFDIHTDISYILSDATGNVLLKKRYAEVFPDFFTKGLFPLDQAENALQDMDSVAVINIQAFLTNKDFVRIMKEKCT